MLVLVALFATGRDFETALPETGYNESHKSTLSNGQSSDHFCLVTNF